MTSTPSLDISEYWRPYESVANSWKRLQELVETLFEQYGDRQFAWRGAVNSAWGLHSSLYRRLWWTERRTGATAPPTEDALLEAESKVVGEVRRWGLHSGSRGLLKPLELLAQLQHYGVPTRFIDVTFNPFAAIFFAVEPDMAAGVDCNAKHDARVLMIDVTNRLINMNKEHTWEELDSVPWKGNGKPDDWKTSVRVWRPAGFDRRMTAQHGGFLLGGVPEGASLPLWPKDPGKPGDSLSIEELRAATSLATRPHKLEAKAGRPPNVGQAMFTIRIEAGAKEEIRNALSTRYGMDHSTVYPDFSGLSAFGMRHLDSKPA